jgi:triosephosphate isomerase (TIM)
VLNVQLPYPLRTKLAMRRKIIAGNWKMNLTLQEAESLADALIKEDFSGNDTEMILAPPYVYLQWLAGKIQAHPQLQVAAQNCSEHAAGAFTGEVSAAMLASLGVTYCITGHSERRTLFGETDTLLAAKVNRLLENNLYPIFCCGETLPQRESQRHMQTVKDQLHQGLFHLGSKAIEKCILAYEPVWAIGTGITASPQQAQEMHEFIRNTLAEKYSKEVAGHIPILYGGSVTASNASDLFSCPDVDGALVGGASLKAGEFRKILQATSINQG